MKILSKKAAALRPLILLLVFLVYPATGQARSSRDMTIGIMGMGNIQLLETIPEFDPGPGGGAYFDYRFNQRFSIQVDAWATTHDGTDRSAGDSGIEFVGIPTFTIKLYVSDNETSRWDPYAGIGIGVFATSEGSIENGTNGLGLGAQIDVGFDYHLSDIFSVGLGGVFRSAGIITSLSNNRNNATAIIPYSLVARLGFHL